MGTGAATAADLFNYMMEATAPAWAGYANCFVALHTADPTGGNQNTSEVAYTGYGRVPVARTAGGWTTVSNVVSTAAAVTFGQCTGGSSTATYFSVGTLTSGAGQIFFSAQLTCTGNQLIINPNITPSFAIGQLTATMT